MFAFLPGVPGEVRDLARRIDTARHHGVPSGCILELDLQAPPPETAGFDPLAFIAGGGRPLLLRDAVAAIHAAIGRRRAQPTTHDLRDAMRAARAGVEPTEPAAKPIGCFIEFTAPAGGGAS